MSQVHIFNHRAMATHFQVRISGEERAYAGQAAEAAFVMVNDLESRLSRFRAESEIARIMQLRVGDKLRLTEPVFSCLKLAQKMEFGTRGVFSITAAARKTQPTRPLWSLLDDELSLRCDSGRLEFDLGAIGKGFALDRMAEVLGDWSCPAFLLIAGGSSVLAGDPPTGQSGWDCGLGEDNSPKRCFLRNASLSGSGLAVKGAHILDPRTGLPAGGRHRAWAIATAAAESDALSTACMLLNEAEISAILERNCDWLVVLEEKGAWRHLGLRTVPTNWNEV